MRRLIGLGLVACWLSLVSSIDCSVADVVKMEREEVIQRSNLIITGQVLEKSPRWNDKGNMIVTDYVVGVDEVLLGKHSELTIKLTFAGGQLPEEGQSVSDVPSFQVGQVVLLMLETDKGPLFSPITGVYQGKFTAVQMQGQTEVIAFDGLDLAIKDSNGGVVTFEDFKKVVKQEIPIAKNKPLPDRSVPKELLPFVIQDLPILKYDSNSIAPQATGLPPLPNPKRDSPPELNEQELNKPAFKGDKDQSGNGTEGPQEWSYAHRSKNVPVVFNPWPASFPELLRYHDQYAMSFWNRYANIYQVMAPTGNWAWQNNRYDMAGFPDNQTMIDQFGAPWQSNTLAVCWLRWDSTGFSIEADIAVNPAFNWTTIDFLTYNNTNLHNLDATLTHEVGHAWGLEHQFNALSIMNYSPHKYRAFNQIYMDDILGLRAAFAPQSVSRTDLGVALYYADGYQYFSDSTVSSQSVAPGDGVTIGNIVIENSGTATISPTIDWYLVPTIGSWTSSYFVGQTSHSSLAAGNWFLTSRTLTIPTGIPNGTYYFAAFVANTSDSVGENNSSWLDRTITLTNPIQPPSNDNWANGIGISPIPATRIGTNIGATEQPNEQNLIPALATVWWFAQAPTTGTMTIGTFGSNFDTMLHVYTGYESGFPNLVLVATNDDANGGLQSRVEFPVVAGQYYEIRVAGYNGATGSIQLSVSFQPDIVLGDANDDGFFDFGDIEAFVLALTDPGAYANAYPLVDVDQVLDMNNDGVFDFGDIEAFVQALLGQ